MLIDVQIVQFDIQTGQKSDEISGQAVKSREKKEKEGRETKRMGNNLHEVEKKRNGEIRKGSLGDGTDRDCQGKNLQNVHLVMVHLNCFVCLLIIKL